MYERAEITKQFAEMRRTNLQLRDRVLIERQPSRTRLENSALINSLGGFILLLGGHYGQTFGAEQTPLPPHYQITQ